MARRPALRALAQRCGILPGYVGHGGRTRSTSDAARVALLGAMGHGAADEAAARGSLEALEAADAERLLPPTAVSHAGRPHRVSVAPAARLGGAWRVEWSLRQEDGRTREGTSRTHVTRGGTLAGLRLPEPAEGIHELRLRLHGPGGSREARQTWIVAPRTCLPVADVLGRRRCFGLWTNLYALRSQDGLGVGHLSDLRSLVRFAGARGADFVGINPLHALRNRPPEISPYGPVSRLFRNPLYLDVARTPEWQACAAARRELEAATASGALERLRSGAQIDYAGTATLQRKLLEPLYRSFRAQHATGRTPRGRAHGRYASAQGDLLRDFATFCALEEQLAADGHGHDWRRWPRLWQRPDAPAVAAFRKRHPERVGLHAWVQFELDRQLSDTASHARRAGLAIGVYQDLAVGSLGSSFDTWAFPGLFLDGASLGAPPDAYAAEGQDWGLPPLDPRALAEDGFRYWRLLLGAGFSHAGALRIDHALGMVRQWWVPRGRPATEGAYVRLPTRELLAVLALESRRHGALVVAEDLGTVPRGFAATLARAAILSSRVLLFERDRRGAFRSASQYSRRALVTANTHDLPPLAGFWQGRDLALRAEIGTLKGAALTAARAERAGARTALWRRLDADGLLTGRAAPASAGDRESLPCAAVTAFLCRTPAPLVGLSLDDLAGETEPVNLPGVAVERFPSWTRRMRLPLERLGDHPDVQRAIAPAARRARRGTTRARPRPGRGPGLR